MLQTEWEIGRDGAHTGTQVSEAPGCKDCGQMTLGIWGVVIVVALLVAWRET